MEPWISDQQLPQTSMIQLIRKNMSATDTYFICIVTYNDTSELRSGFSKQ